MAVLETLGLRLRAAMKQKGVKNPALAEAAGVHVKTVSKWLHDSQVPDPEALDRAAAFLGVSAEWLRKGGVNVAPVVRESGPGYGYGASTTLTRRLAHAPRALAVAAGYLHRLEEAGVPPETIEEAERLMLDGTYNKLHARDPRQRTEDDLVTDIEAAWAFISLVLREQGVRL